MLTLLYSKSRAIAALIKSSHIILIMTQPLNLHPNYEYFLDLFQQYSADLLRGHNQEVRESLRRRHIYTDKLPGLEEAYKISLKLGRAIPVERIEKQILQQIDAAAHFIKNLRIWTLGQRNELFHIYEIEIMIDNCIKYSFEFEAGKLLIQIPYWQLFFFKRYLGYQVIKNLWNRGKHLDKASPIYRVWWLFNPVGEFRYTLRAMLLLAVEKQILGIDKLLIELGFADVGDHKNLLLKDEARETKSFKGDTVPSTVRQAALAFLKVTVNEEKLGVNLEQILKDQDEETLIRLLALFKKNLSDPTQIEEIIEAGILILKEFIQEEQSQVDIKMFGFVNVGNYHRIEVALNLNSACFKNYIEVIPRKASIKAILFGFVNVYTIDNITVKPNFQGAMKLNFETIALERTLKELQLLV